MRKDPTPITLISQGFEPGPVPGTGDGASEKQRLQAMLGGSYQLVMSQQMEWSFYGAILRGPLEDGDASSEDQAQFRIGDAPLGTGHTLTIESLQEGFTIAPIEIIPLDREKQPLAFEEMEACPERRTIKVLGGKLAQALKIQSPLPNLLTAGEVHAYARSYESPWVGFRNPLVPLARRSESLSLHLLEGDHATPRTFEEYLRTFFRCLFAGDKGHVVSLQCNLEYPFGDSGFESSLIPMPVLFQPAEEYHDDLPRSVASGALDWFGTHFQDDDYPTGQCQFVLSLTVSHTGDRTVHKPILQLDSLLLPITAVADL